MSLKPGLRPPSCRTPQGDPTAPTGGTLACWVGRRSPGLGRSPGRRLGGQGESCREKAEKWVSGGRGGATTAPLPASTSYLLLSSLFGIPGS